MSTMEAERELPPMLQVALLAFPRPRMAGSNVRHTPPRVQLLRHFLYRTSRIAAALVEVMEEAVALAEKNQSKQRAETSLRVQRGPGGTTDNSPQFTGGTRDQSRRSAGVSTESQSAPALLLDWSAVSRSNWRLLSVVPPGTSLDSQTCLALCFD